MVVSIKPNTTYTVTCNEPTLIRLATSVNYPASGGAISVYEYRSGSKVEPLTITTGNDDKWLLMQLLVNADATNGYTLEKCVESLQLELGSTATYYEPYNSETFAIDSGKPVEIVALEGVNSLFADNGAITVRCRLDAAAMYDYITNEIISLGADI